MEGDDNGDHSVHRSDGGDAGMSMDVGVLDAHMDPDPPHTRLGLGDKRGEVSLVIGCFGDAGGFMNGGGMGGEGAWSSPTSGKLSWSESGSGLDSGSGMVS